MDAQPAARSRDERALRLNAQLPEAAPEALDASYVARMDADVYGPLRALSGARVCDFEDLFYKFERAYFDGRPELHALTDLLAAPAMRLLWALQRYSH